MNYEQMSYFEINKAVAAAMGITDWFVSPKCGMNNTGSWIFSEDCQGDSLPLPDYCKNPADAWPVIVSSGISIINHGDEFEACTGFESSCGEGGGYFVDYEYTHTNPLRAAMIVYLMMKESDK